MRVLRISHSAVVSAWRERDRVLRADGIDLELISARSWVEGGQIVAFTADGDDFATPVRTWGSHPNLFAYAPRPIWRLLGQGRWDVIDIHEEPCSIATFEVLILRALRRVRTPFVLYSAQNIEKRYPPPFRWMERWALLRAGGVSVCNTDAGRIVRKKGLRGVVAEIPLGVDLAVFAPRESDHPSHEFVIGYVGRLVDYKGVDVLLDAVADPAAPPDSKVVLVGAGPDEASLRAQAARLRIGDRLDFHGHAGTSELAELYRTFDVLVVPSLPTPNWLEQFGRVAVEAMASGVPVIASDSGALPDVVGGAGLLVPPGDPVALAAAISALASDPERWQKLRAAGLDRSMLYTWQAVAQGMQTLYRALTHPQPPSSGLDVIVVAYGEPDQLADALRPIAGHLPVTIVDNSSLPSTRALAERLGAGYLDPGRNLGFGAGVNYALARRADSNRDVLLLNPDAAIGLDGITKLRSALAADDSLGCVAPVQVDPQGHPARVRWPFPSPARAWLDNLGLGRIPHRRGFVIGSILLIRSQTLAEVGPFDERFFLYAEETDWQLRAFRAGWRAGLVPGVDAMHVGAGTGGDSAVREGYFHASHELLIRKHYGRWGWWAYRSAAIVGAAARSAAPGHERRARARARLRTYAKGPMKMVDRA